jgi:hypothetical protein
MAFLFQMFFILAITCNLVQIKNLQVFKAELQIRLSRGLIS